MANTEKRHISTEKKDKKGFESTSHEDPQSPIPVLQGELERSFSWFGALGLGATICNSWLGYAASFTQAVSYGGAVTVFFGLIAAAAVQWIVVLGLAELSSAFPSSGGQYHFTYMIAPARFKRFAAYTVGVFNVITWWVTTASGTFLTAISVFGIVMFWHPEYTGAQWHVYLCYVLIVFLTLIPIFAIPHRNIDHITQTSLYLSMIGFVTTFIVMAVMGRGNYHPSNLVDYHASSGWSAGPSWMMSIGVGQYAFAAAGACTHIAEELPRPTRQVPLIINLTMAIGIITAVPWFVIALSLVQDMDSIQNSFLPSLELFYQATGSKVAATFLQSYMSMLYYSCIPGQWITSSRIAWAFARDNGLPFSEYWNNVHPHFNFPVRTTILSVAVCIVYGILYIASTRAFNTIINTSVLMLNLTYTVPQGILATAGRGRLPPRPFNLGIFGYAVNVFSVLWLIVSGVFFCFPTSNPTSISSMNYGSVVIVGIFILVLLLWIERRKKFQGPNLNWDMLRASETS